MKRQPTTCGSSPWQQVERPLAWRGVAPVWPIWFMWVRKGRTGSPSPPWSTSDLLLPRDAPECAQEAEDQFAGLGGMDLAVGLFLGPACAGDEEHFGVGADGLRVLGRGAESADGGADVRGVRRRPARLGCAGLRRR